MELRQCAMSYALTVLFTTAIRQLVLVEMFTSVTLALQPNKIGL